jgi:hypothetical protein
MTDKASGVLYWVNLKTVRDCQMVDFGYGPQVLIPLSQWKEADPLDSGQLCIFPQAA